LVKIKAAIHIGLAHLSDGWPGHIASDAQACCALEVAPKPVQKDGKPGRIDLEQMF